MIGLPNQDPSRAAAAKLKHQMLAKKAARAYQIRCENCQMDPLEARRVAPPLVREGIALRNIEAKKRKREALQKRKAKMENRFGR